MAAQQQSVEFAGRKRIVDAIRSLANWATIQLASDFKDRSTPAAGLLDREALLTMGLVPVDDLRTVVRARDLYRRECLAAKRAFVVLHNAVDPLVDAVIGGGPKDECFNRLATFAYDREQDIRYEKVLARGYTQHLKGAGLWRVPITRQTLAPWPVPAATPTASTTGPSTALTVTLPAPTTTKRTVEIRPRVKEEPTVKRPRVVHVIPRTRGVIESEGSTVQRPQWSSTSYAVEPRQTRTRKAILPRRVVRMGTPPSPPSDGPRYFPRTPLPDGSIDAEAASAAAAAVNNPPLDPITTVRPIVIAPIPDDDEKNDEPPVMK